MKSYFAILLMAVATFGSTQMIAQQKFATYSKVDQTDYPYMYLENDPAQARFYTLKNGLTVILAVQQDAPKIATMIATKAGSKHDPETHTGLAHYLEHMLFKGTDKYGTIDFEKEKPYLDQIDSLYEAYNQTTAETIRKAIYKAIDSVSVLAAEWAIPNEYDKMMQIIGATGTNAYTSFEETVYLNTIPSNEVHRWVRIESERFRNPILRLFHTELEAVYEEKNISLDNTISQVYEKLLAHLFPNHNYGKQTTIGTVEHLKNPSLRAIRDYYKTYYVPNNMAIVMVGDLDCDETIEMIAHHFDYMEASHIPPFTFERELPMAEPVELEITDPSSEALYMAYRLPGAQTKEADLMTMVDLILSNSSSGLIDLNLVKKQQILQAGSYGMSLQDYSMHMLYATPKEGQSLADARNLLLAQLDSIKQGNFDEKLLQAIVLNETVDELKNFENISMLASELTNSFIRGSETHWLDRLNRNYRLSQITRKDIIKFAKQYYQNNCVIVYKKQGEAPERAQIDKPQISKIDVTREVMSAFAEDIKNENTLPLEPVFPDFNALMKQDTLALGTPYFYINNDRNPLFSMYYVFDYGTLHSKTLSLALDYLNYVGTAKTESFPELGSNQISTRFYEMGSTFGMSSNTQYAYIYLHGLEEHKEESIDLLHHLIQHAMADSSALEELKNRIIKNRSNNLTNKTQIRRALEHFALYGQKNPFNFVLTNAQLAAVTAQDLIEEVQQLFAKPHHLVYYGPNCVSKSAQFNNTSYPWLSKLSTDPNQNKEQAQFSPITTKKTRVYFAEYDMIQTEISWQKAVGNYQRDQVAPIMAFNDYFGGGMSSLVFQEIREAQALAYSTYAVVRPARFYNDINIMNAYVGTQYDKLDQALLSMNDLLINPPENMAALNQVVNSLMSNIRSQRITKSQIYFSWRNMQSFKEDQIRSQILYNSLPNLTLTDVLTYHNQHIKPRAYHISIMGNPKLISKKQLKKYGKVQKTPKLEKLFGYE